ncbi:MAG: hypothetical protein AB1445_15800 [Bacillota bacterium]
MSAVLQLDWSVNEDAFAEVGLDNRLEGIMVNGVGEHRRLAVKVEFHPQELSKVLGSQQLVDLLLGSRERGWLAAAARSGQFLL